MIGGDANPARQAAHVVGDVTRATAAGDPVARDLLAQAVCALVTTTRAAASRCGLPEPVPVALVGVETLRQWSNPAIVRFTPYPLGLFSWITLLANDRYAARAPMVRIVAWQQKSLPIFGDANASLVVTRRRERRTTDGLDPDQSNGIFPKYFVRQPSERIGRQ